MIAVPPAADPSRALYRIGRAPDPLNWPLSDRRGTNWLEFRGFETREALRRRFARELLDLGLPDLDVSAALTSHRTLTQAIARWAYENGYHGIAYTSRFDVAFNCWAVFDNAAIEPILPFERIDRDDPDLRAAAVLFGLAL